MDAVTFIIPTMGRTTLDKTIRSLKEQTNPNWFAIIAFDSNYSINYTPDDYRIQVYQANIGGHAGLIRNYAMDFVGTDWIAFLDDDDWLANTYVERLQSHSNSKPELDIVIFTYEDVTNGNTIPPRKTKDFESCKVGISFAVKTEFIRSHNIKFTPFAVEDFRFLDECRSAGAKYIVTNDIQYFVGGRGKWLMR